MNWPSPTPIHRRTFTNRTAHPACLKSYAFWKDEPTTTDPKKVTCVQCKSSTAY